MTVEEKIKYWCDFMHTADYALVVSADEYDNVCGFIALEPELEIENCLYIASLHIDRDYRGKAIGTKLIEYVHFLADSLGCQNVSISIVCGNDRAKALYEKLGAIHYKFFIDDFGGATAKSEKLIWKKLIKLGR